MTTTLKTSFTAQPHAAFFCPLCDNTAYEPLPVSGVYRCSQCRFCFVNPSKYRTSMLQCLEASSPQTA